MADKPAAPGPRRVRSAGRWFVSAGVSLFMMADHIFHNRRDLPALIVKAPKPAAPRRTFELPEPLAPVVRPTVRRSRGDRS